MLRLEKMSLRGFKSFGDATEVRFRPGITAVVGPNGCGKSNIGDALNWVLGEQSAKMLRGQQMADVIFNGSEARKPLGLAEVTLTFGGADGLAAAEQDRIAITRRLFRSGESEYLLNGARTRLRDIQELLREGHVGARTYATIEQGKIDQVLNAKPRDRRALIEDAAGISGYKLKRRTAEFKLEATYANLLRVNDIVAEVARQINSLKRQAARARRWRRLREELRSKELVRFVEQAAVLEAELDRLRRDEAGARAAEAAAVDELERLEAVLVALRGALETGERVEREAADELHRGEIDVDRKRSRVQGCRDRAAELSGRADQHRAEIEASAARARELETRRDATGARLAEIEERLERLEADSARERASVEHVEAERVERSRRIEELRRRQYEAMSRAAELRNRVASTEEALVRNRELRSRLDAERAEAGQEFARSASEVTELEGASAALRRWVGEQRRRQSEIDRALATGRERQDALVEALAVCREREKSAQARLATLEALETRFAGVSDGVRALLSSGPASGIRLHGVIADYVETSREYEAAAESYLCALLPTVIVEDDGDATRAASLLRTAGAGRTSLVCRSQPVGALAVGSPGNGHASFPERLLSDGRVLGRLRDRLTLKSSANGALADRIGDALLVDRLETALELHREHPAADYVTPLGEVVYASGLISTSGRPDGDAGLLAHKRRTEAVRVELAVAASGLGELQRELEAARADVVRLEVDARDNRQELEDGERRAMELELRVQRSSEERLRSERRSEVLIDEISAIEADSAALAAAREQLVAEGRAAEVAQGELTAALAAEAGLHAEAEGHLKQQAERAGGLRAEHAATRQLLMSSRDEAERVAADLAEVVGRLGALATEVAEAERVMRESLESALGLEQELAAELAACEELAGRIRGLEEDSARRRAELAGHEEELRGRRTALEEHRERTRHAEVERIRTESSRAHLDDLCRQELDLSIDEARASAAAAAATLTSAPATHPEEDDEGGADEAEDVKDVEVAGGADLTALDDQIAALKRQLERLGPVNMTAIEEFTELEERYAFLTAQKQDLESSMEALRESIRRIDRQSRQKFLDAFEAIRQSYQEIYRSLFSGGRADLRLEESEDVLDCGIEILAQPPGKRLTGVHLLSGGEKALSAIALLFAIFRFQPSPFCLLDEVDAALDDANVARFTRMLVDYARNTQFIIVTHNKMSMEAADVLYGVTMQEPGVSTLVSLEIH